jgi:glycosyltransferase involved in cell wall biosynthesis
VESTLRELAPRHDLTVYCTGGAAAAGHIPGVRVVSFPSSGRGGVGVFLYYARCLLHALRQDYDLVHVHKTDAAFALPFLALRFACVSTSHERAYLNSKWSALGRAYFRLAERIFMSARSIRTCVSREQRQHYLERYGREVHYVPNGVEEPAFDDEAAARLLAAAGVRAGFLLFAARRIIPLKGAHLLLAALERLGFRGQLVIVGDLGQMPDYSAELQARARGLDVRFLGYVAERATLLALVRRSSLFVFPSEREGMSLMLLEAAACGTPILCSDIRANMDVLGPDEVATFQSGDAGDLAAGLAALFADPAGARARAERARQRVARDYSAASVAHAYERLYERALREERAARPSRIGAAVRRARRTLRRLATVDVWNVGLVEAPIHAFLAPGFRPTVQWLPDAGVTRLSADPFALEHEGRRWLLYEGLEHSEGRGFLAARELGPQGFGPERVVLRAPFHLSYPWLLRRGDEVFCVPESWEAREVALYRARRFPEGWERVAALLPGVAGIDSTVLQHEGRWWCFTTEKGKGHDRRLLLYHADDLLGPWRPHRGNPVKVDLRSARGAGTPFHHGGALYRPAQDYSETKEGRITLNRVLELTPESFVEETVATIEPLGSGPYPDKIHTLSAAGERTLVDGCREVFVLRHHALLLFKLARARAALFPRRAAAVARH